MLGFGELLVILVIVLLLVGSKRLPEIGKSLGESIREFQKAMRGDTKNSDNQERKHGP